MKNLISALIVLFSINAFATKARLQALSNSGHLVDTQSIYANPLDIMTLKNFITFESGSTAATSSTDNAEGSISYGLNDRMQLAVSLGHVDDAIMGARSLINTTLGTTYVTPQNPIHLFYGYKGADMTFAFGISNSNKNDKQNDLKENSTLVSFGVLQGSLQVYAVYSLVNSVDAAGGKKFDGSGYANLAGRYTLDTMTLGLDYYAAKARSSTNGVEDISDSYQAIAGNLVDVRTKDGSDYFYGAQVISSSLKNVTSGKDLKRTTLPVWFGIEAKGAEFLTIRGSIQQTMLVAQAKDEAGFTAGGGYLAGATGAVSDFTSEPGNTTAAFGLGFNYNNINVDGTLKGLIGTTAVNQRVDQNNFLSQVGMTYIY
ncbi:MAG: hypothetical protein WA160_01370 [Pseudobdellovibrio sp.]